MEMENGTGRLHPVPAAGSIITGNMAEFRNGNGDGGSPAWEAGPAPGNYCGGASGFGNGEWRRISSTCFQLPVPAAPVLMSTTQKGRGQWAMESMEGATKPEKIYSNV